MSDGGNVVKNTRASSNFKWTCVLTSKLLEILTVLSKDPTFGTSAGSFKAKAFNKAVASLMESRRGENIPEYFKPEQLKGISSCMCFQVHQYHFYLPLYSSRTGKEQMDCS